MALAISIEGKGVIANCDQLTNDTGGSGTDDWLELGGGSISDEADAFLYGTTSIGNQYASKSGWTYLNMTTALDFDTAGAEEGQFIYIWLNIAAPNAFDTIANKGFAIRLGTTTTDYREYVIAGEDDSNGWAGGWKLFVVDPTKPGTVTDTGTFDVGDVGLVGIWIDTNASVRADSIFIDQIAVGNGLRITGTWDSGTYGGAWEEVLAYCNDYSNRAWGMLQERDGVYYAFGKFWIGDSTQAADTVFEDSGKFIQFGTSQYYYSSGWVSTMPTDAYGIIIEDHATYTTDFKDGIQVGTEEQGRSGSVFIGNADQAVSMDLYGGSNSSSLTELYGTQFVKLTGAINLGDNSNHIVYSCVFDQCAQFDPVGAPEIRNCQFINTIDTDAALLWNEGIDIQNCSFIANTTGAGIEHPVITSNSYTYTNLVFSGNSPYDILNTPNASTVSAGSFTVGRGYKIKTAGDTVWTDIGAADNNVGTKFVATGIGSGTGDATDLLVISKGGISDPTTSEDAGTEADELLLSSIEITINVQDADTVDIEGAQVGIYTIPGRAEIMNEATTAGGVAYEAYSGTTPGDVEIRVRKASVGDTKYKPYSTLANISSDYTLLVTLEEQLF